MASGSSPCVPSPHPHNSGASFCSFHSGFMRGLYVIQYSVAYRPLTRASSVPYKPLYACNPPPPPYKPVCACTPAHDSIDRRATGARHMVGLRARAHYGTLQHTLDSGTSICTRAALSCGLTKEMLFSRWLAVMMRVNSWLSWWGYLLFLGGVVLYHSWVTVITSREKCSGTVEKQIADCRTF